MSFDGTTIDQALARDESRQNLDGVPPLSSGGRGDIYSWLQTATDQQKRAVIFDLNKQLGIKPLVKKPRSCTDAEIQAWADRYDLGSGESIGSLRVMFEDAASVSATPVDSTI